MANKKTNLTAEETEKLNEYKRLAEDNSRSWHETDDKEKKAGLNRANQLLYSKMDEITGGKSVYNKESGKWDTAYSDGDGNWNFDNVPTQKSFNSPWTGKVNDLAEDIENSKFSYNPNNDASYNAYKDMYRREGERASKSTLADIATAQGGISSYAAQAAQAQNNYYAQQLMDKIPELEALAYQKYQAYKNDKYNILNTYMNREDQDYQRFITDREYQNYLDERKFSNNAYLDERAFERMKYADSKEQQQYQNKFAEREYNDKQFDDAYNIVLNAMQMGYTPHSKYLNTIDMPYDEFFNMRDAYYAPSVKKNNIINRGNPSDEDEDEDDYTGTEPTADGYMTKEEKNSRIMAIWDAVEKGTMTESEAAMRLASVDLFGNK